MAYYLMYDAGKKNKKEVYEIIDITKAPIFTRISKSLKNQGCTIEEIDNFTLNFNNSLEISKYLVGNGLLPMDKMDRKLSIRQIRKGEYDKVYYDLLYQKDIDYVFNPDKIIKRINDKLWIEKDFRFIEKLVNRFYNNHDCSSTIPEVRTAILETIRIGNISNMFNMRDNNGDDLLTRLIKLLIYDYYQSSDGKIHYITTAGNYSRNYNNLHSVIAFVNNYDKKYNNKDDDSLIETSSNGIAPMIQPVTASKPKPKTLSRKKDSKKYVLEEQMSMFNKK